MEGGHFCPNVMICGMSNSTKIEIGWSHVVVSTTIEVIKNKIDSLSTTKWMKSSMKGEEEEKN